MAAGASSPIQEIELKPGTTDSASVGTSGRAPTRLSLVTARARSLPALMWPLASSTVMKDSCTWPASRSLMAGPPPRYGTCRMKVPVDSLNISAARCGPPPAPELL